VNAGEFFTSVEKGKQADGRTSGQADGRTSGQADERTSGRADKRIDDISILQFTLFF